MDDDEFLSPEKSLIDQLRDTKELSSSKFDYVNLALETIFESSVLLAFNYFKLSEFLKIYS